MHIRTQSKRDEGSAWNLFANRCESPGPRCPKPRLAQKLLQEINSDKLDKDLTVKDSGEQGIEAATGIKSETFVLISDLSRSLDMRKDLDIYKG